MLFNNNSENTKFYSECWRTFCNSSAFTI